MQAASDHPPTEPHIILVGLPGAGKSTIGRGVACALDRPFVDFDREIEARAQLSVAEIFRAFGEPFFRRLEADLSAEIGAAPSPGMVLAPGGGWIANARATAALRPTSRLVYLRIRPESALFRLHSDPNVRPLLAVDDPLATLRHLLTVREQNYLQADEILDVDLLGVEEVIAIVTTRALAWRSATP